jgi:hypothetical protein
MAIDPQIALSVNPAAPPPNPLATLAQLSQLRGAAVENQLRQQQMATSAAEQQNYQAQADQKRRDLADQNTTREFLKDPNNAKALAQWDGTTAFPLAGKISPGFQDTLAKSITEQQKNAAVATGEQRKLNDAMHAQIGDTLNGILYDETGKKRSDADVARLAPAAFAQLVQDKNLKPENVPAITNWDDGNAFAVKNRFVEGLNAYSTKAQEAVQKVKTDASAEALNKAHALQFAADADKLVQDKINAQANLPKLQADAAIAKLDADFKAAHGGLGAEDVAKNKISMGELSVKQAEQNLRSKEFTAKYGDPSSRAAFTESVKRDPDSYFSLSPEMKVSVAHDLVAQGLNVPVQVPGDLKTRAVSADLGLKAIGRIRELMSDPDIAGSVGAISGRLGNVEQKVGDTFFGQGTPQAAKEQELRTNFAYLKLLEGKGLLGGRPAAQLFDQLSGVTANPKMAPALINGSLNAMSSNLNNVKDETHAYSFGGAGNATQTGALPDAAKAQLKKGIDTTFSNGQVWTLDASGQEKRIK